MKVTLTHGEKSVELDLTAEQLASLGLKEEKKRTGYERVNNGAAYWVEGINTTVYHCREDNVVEDNLRFNGGNYHSDENLAYANLRADTLMRKLRRYAAEHGGICSKEDWEKERDNFGIYFDYINHRLMTYGAFLSREFGNIYFRDEQACKDAIKEFRDELTWYFTEYQAMLY